MEKRKFEITGMTCSACVAHVERAVKKLGAEEVSVSLMTNGMTLCGDMPDAQIVEAVEKAGLGKIFVKLFNSRSPSRHPARTPIKRRLPQPRNGFGCPWAFWWCSCTFLWSICSAGPCRRFCWAMKTR